MTLAPNRGMLYAAFLAVALHALLFFAVHPRLESGLKGIPVAPQTRYLAQGDPKLPMTGVDVRTVMSPVVFSLPTSMGFSGELERNDVSRSLLHTLPRTGQSESFLEIAPHAGRESEALTLKEMMVTSERTAAPPVPFDIFQASETRPAARRVTITPALKERLVGGVVLPAPLNQAVEKPWEIRAALSISREGTVEHVFLDAPLESTQLNAQVLQLLYGLRFKPGKPVEGGIEIYSPQASGKGEAAE